jgi:hypothetical protein
MRRTRATLGDRRPEAHRRRRQGQRTHWPARSATSAAGRVRSRPPEPPPHHPMRLEDGVDVAGRSAGAVPIDHRVGERHPRSPPGSAADRRRSRDPQLLRRHIYPASAEGSRSMYQRVHPRRAGVDPIDRHRSQGVRTAAARAESPPIPIGTPPGTPLPVATSASRQRRRAGRRASARSAVGIRGLDDRPHTGRWFISGHDIRKQHPPRDEWGGWDPNPRPRDDESGQAHVEN